MTDTSPSLSVARHVTNGTEWYDYHFIIRHCQILFHKYYRPDVVRVNVMSNNTPVTQEEICNINEDIRTSHAVLPGGTRYVVMELHVRQ
jgi:hypothetical protein